MYIFFFPDKNSIRYIYLGTIQLRILQIFFEAGLKMEKTTVVVELVIGVMSSRNWAMQARVWERLKALEV